MKTHLLRPGERITMCGKQIKSFSTTNPAKVDCKMCSGMYAVNTEWYEKLSKMAKKLSLPEKTVDQLF